MDAGMKPIQACSWQINVSRSLISKSGTLVGPGACEAPKRGILVVGYDLFTCVVNQSIIKEAIVLNMNDM